MKSLAPGPLKTETRPIDTSCASQIIYKILKTTKKHPIPKRHLKLFSKINLPLHSFRSWPTKSYSASNLLCMESTTSKIIEAEGWAELASATFIKAKGSAELADDQDRRCTLGTLSRASTDWIIDFSAELASGKANTVFRWTVFRRTVFRNKKHLRV